ncbi:MAG: NAD(+)/NADH kinase [Betaproteobacteria bacterium]|nr:NAD(+)/NADH kinase [Betaproteobacteria bacterium]
MTPTPAPLHYPLHTIALVGKYHSPEVSESLRLLANHLCSRGIDVLLEEETAVHIGCGETDPDLRHCVRASFDEIGQRAEVAIVLGGDGTMLAAARQLARYQVPLVGVNQGRLGFMTDIALNDMLSCMVDLLEGKFTPEHRVMLDGEIRRAPGSRGSDGRAAPEATNIVLNEVVVDKGTSGKMVELELFIDGEFIYNLRADGLIVSTPTGSTAYALSANGPIMHPQVSGIALVPLSPHALTNRPIMVGNRAEIEVRAGAASECRVYFDGHVSVDLMPGDSLSLRRSKNTICFLHPPGYSYFTMLRQKLHWSERPRS